MNLNLIRGLSACLQNCDSDSEAQVILGAVNQLASGQTPKVDDSNLDLYAMDCALKIKEKKQENNGVYAGFPYYAVSKIQLIRHIRELKNWGLKQAKDYVETLPIRFG